MLIMIFLVPNKADFSSDIGSIVFVNQLVVNADTFDI